MKKLSLFVGLITLGTTTAFAASAEEMVRSISPEAILAAGLGGFIVLVGLVLSYIALSYGTYLLAKKYAPKVHLAWSWIPVAQLYPLVVVSGQSPWWIAAILLGNFIPGIGWIIVLGASVFIYHSISKRVGGGVGTTLLLLFFSVIMIPYLGLKAHKKSTTPAWLLGIAAILALLIGGAVSAAGAGKAMIELERDYNVMGRAQGKMMDEIKDNPEFQKQLQDAKDAMMKIEQKAEINVGAE